MENTNCILTGMPIKNVKPTASPLLEYSNEIAGNVKIAHGALIKYSKGNFDKKAILGICRTRTILNQEPVIIDIPFIEGGYKLLNPPTSFEEKSEKFLNLLFEIGGAENTPLDVQTNIDYPMAFAEPSEFEKILDALINSNFIETDGKRLISAMNSQYRNLRLSTKGRSRFVKSIFTEEKSPATFNIINANTVSNSSIQQGSENSSLNSTYTIARTEDIDKFIELLTESIEKLTLNVEDQSVLLTDIKTIQEQKKSLKPKNIIITESLKSIRSILEKVTADGIGPVLIEKTNELIQMFVG